ncbi:MAG: hypothetical protein SOW18_02815 [Peptoniphilus sp.]|nr:hypothetical protein [Peptoniphilus sp.]MDY3118452.1 hypothetical protein [Peptoniphilus sp.]
MIQSGVLIQFLLSIIRALENWYKQSVLHSCFFAIGGAVKKQWRASATRRLFDESEGVFAESWCFRFLRFFYRLFNTIVHWVRLRLTAILWSSVGFQIADSYSAMDSALKVSGIASVGFGLSVVILGLLQHNLYGFIGLIFLCAGLFSNFLASGFRDKVAGSYAVSAAKWLWRLLLHDKEVDSWKDA